MTSGTVVARPRASDRAHEVGRRVARVHVGEVEERLEVPPGCDVPRREPRVVPVGVHGLLVVGLARVLRRRQRLVEPEIGRLQRAFGEVDDRRVHAQPVEGGEAGTGTPPASGAARDGSPDRPRATYIAFGSAGCPSRRSCSPAGSAWYSAAVGNISRRSRVAASISSVGTRPSISTQPLSCQAAT